VFVLFNVFLNTKQMWGGILLKDEKGESDGILQQPKCAF